MSPQAVDLQPVQVVKRTIRSIRDGWYERPHPWYRPREIVRGRWSSAAVTHALRTQGICILERVIEESSLARYQEALERALTEAPQRPPGPHDVPRATSRRIDSAQDPVLAALLLDDLVLAGIEGYYGKPIALALAQAQRLEPIASYEGKAFQWHHDTKGKYVKAMWLLTDVPSTGQRMSYVVGSHAMRHRWSSYEDTRFPDEQARRLGPVVECAGPAGTVIVFDTNGIHRGNRNLGPRRDTVVGVYTAGRYLEGCSFDLSRLSALQGWQQDIVRRSRIAQRRSPSAE